MNPQPQHKSPLHPKSQYKGPLHPHGEDDRLLTMTEVADLTRLPVATLRFKRHQGTGPRSFRLGRRVFYWHSDVLAWIAQHYNGDGPHAA